MKPVFLALLLALMTSCSTNEVTLEQKTRYHVDVTSAGMIRVDTWTGKTEVFTRNGWIEIRGLEYLNEKPKAKGERVFGGRE